MPITDYMLLEARSAYELRKMVEIALSLHWQPLGGVCITRLGTDNLLYVQTVVMSKET